MKIYLSTTVRCFDGASKDAGTPVDVPAGSYEVEPIPNPLHPAGGDWLVLAGTKVGMTECAWRQYAVDASTLTASLLDQITVELTYEQTDVLLTLRAECQSVPISPEKLGDLIKQLQHFQNRIEWHYARPHWKYICLKARGKRENKWHLISPLNGSELCSQGPSGKVGTQELIAAGPDIWNGTVCKQCVFLWEQQIQMGIASYHPKPLHSKGEREMECD